MLHHMTDTTAPTGDRWSNRVAAETLAAARDRVRQLDVDSNGNVHRSDVLDALTTDG